MRVLYDISALGLGEIAAEERGGGHRVDRHLTELLSASPECELMFCANYSSLAYEGSIEYLRRHPAVGGVPLIRHEGTWMSRRLRGALAAAHRRLKKMRGGRALPRAVRAGGTLVDARVHRPILDATPPADIHHSATTPLPPRRRSLRAPRRFVTIYDLRAARTEADEAERTYEHALLASIQPDDWVMTSSESTRHELGELGVVAPDQIAVTPLAADSALFHPRGADGDGVRERFGIPQGPFIVMLDSLSPRKNLGHAVAAFATLVQQERLRDLTLVIAGGPTRRSQTSGAENDRAPALRGRVVRTGHVTDEELASLYRAAMALVYPSRYEGFGLPPLEAMQCGTAVITSNTSSLPEVVGDGGIMVDPDDRDALSDAILKLYRDRAFRDAVRQRGLCRAAQFTWERTLDRTLAAYRAAL